MISPLLDPFLVPAKFAASKLKPGTTRSRTSHRLDSDSLPTGIRYARTTRHRLDYSVLPRCGDRVCAATGVRSRGTRGRCAPGASAEPVAGRGDRHRAPQQPGLSLDPE